MVALYLLNDFPESWFTTSVGSGLTTACQIRSDYHFQVPTQEPRAKSPFATYEFAPSSCRCLGKVSRTNAFAEIGHEANLVGKF